MVSKAPKEWMKLELASHFCFPTIHGGFWPIRSYLLLMDGSNDAIISMREYPIQRMHMVDDGYD